MTGRRHFLGVLATAAAGLTFDPERVLWVPGARTFVLPPAGGWTVDRTYRGLADAATELVRMIHARHAARVDGLPWRRVDVEPIAHLARQFGITMEALATGEVSRTQHLEPIATALETHLHTHRLTEFRDLALLPVEFGEDAVCVVHSPELSVRALRAYDVRSGRRTVRFDIFCQRTVRFGSFATG